MTKKLDPRATTFLSLFFNLSLVSNLLKFDLHSSFIVSKIDCEILK